jgi:hypothetical protein
MNRLLLLFQFRFSVLHQCLFVFLYKYYEIALFDYFILSLSLWGAVD